MLTGRWRSREWDLRADRQSTSHRRQGGGTWWLPGSGQAGDGGRQPHSHHPLRLGGGHARWWDRGYDCSGAVGYALHGGGLLEAPMTSGEMTRWGSPGKGRWITIYANSRHVFAVIAGLRWDTVGSDTETGPRWHEEMVSTAGFVARHPPGF
jgi:hypothetical protein